MVWVKVQARTITAKGEQEDVLSVLHYALNTLGWEKSSWRAFSFGAGMACLAACREPEPLRSCFAGPPVHHFDAPAQLPFNFDTHIYYGDQDEIVPIDEMAHWSEAGTAHAPCARV